MLSARRFLHDRIDCEIKICVSFTVKSLKISVGVSHAQTENVHKIAFYYETMDDLLRALFDFCLKAL